MQEKFEYADTVFENSELYIGKFFHTKQTLNSWRKADSLLFSAHISDMEDKWST